VSVFDIYEVSRWKIISLQPYANIFFFFFAIRGIDYAVFDNMEEDDDIFYLKYIKIIFINNFYL